MSGGDSGESWQQGGRAWARRGIDFMRSVRIGPTGPAGGLTPASMKAALDRQAYSLLATKYATLETSEDPARGIQVLDRAESQVHLHTSNAVFYREKLRLCRTSGRLQTSSSGSGSFCRCRLCDFITVISSSKIT